MSSVIEVKNFTKEYGDFKAVDDISFTVEKGQIFGFLGTNGAGKTTTIKALTGQLMKTSGEVSVLGLDVEKNSEEVFPRIGVVGDFQNLYRNFTVKENIEFFCKLYNCPWQKGLAAIEELDLVEKMDSKLSELSKGLNQRVVLAKSIMYEPDILFLDEPSTGLDPISTMAMHNAIRRLKEMGKTIFLTTHFMDEAEELSDKIAFIHKGKLVEAGTPVELKRKYGQPVIKAIFAGEEEKEKEVSLSEEGLKELVQDGRKPISIHSSEASLKDIFIHLLSEEEK